MGSQSLLANLGTGLHSFARDYQRHCLDLKVQSDVAVARSIAARNLVGSGLDAGHYDDLLDLAEKFAEQEHIVKDAEHLMRRGGEQMAVTLAWAGGQLRRTASGCSLPERDIASLFGDPGVVRACLDGFHFLDLDLRGRREMVAQVVGSGKQLADELARVCAGAGVDPETTSRLGDEAVKDPAGAERIAVNRRRELKRELEGLPATPAPAQITIDGKSFDLTKITAHQVEDRLRQRRAEHDECLRAEGAARLLDTPDILAEKIKALKDGLAAQKECAGVDVGCVHDGWKVIRIICTVSHQDHHPENNDGYETTGKVLPVERSNLKFLCQACHNRHDGKHRAGNASATKDKKRGQQRMFG